MNSTNRNFRKRSENRMIERASLTAISVTILIVISVIIASVSALVHTPAIGHGGSVTGEAQSSSEFSSNSEADPSDSQSESESESQSVPDEPKPMYTHASVTASTMTISSGIKSEYAILIDIDNNTVIAEKNMNSTIFPASMTKVMTLIVAYEAVTDWNSTFTMTNDILVPLSEMNASVAGYMHGDVIPLKDLFYGAILPSGADCTAALAILTAGSEEAFAEIMNNKAQELGMTRTHFVNASGLHDDRHYSTLGDIAILMRHALSIDFCREVLDAEKYVTSPVKSSPEGLTLRSTSFSRITHDITGKIRINGAKTGYTGEAMHCMVTGVKVDGGGNYICITAYGETKMTPAEDITYICKNFIK